MHEMFHEDENIQVLCYVVSTYMSSESKEEDQEKLGKEIHSTIKKLSDVLHKYKTTGFGLCEHDTAEQTYMIRADAMITEGAIRVVNEEGIVSEYIDSLETHLDDYLKSDKLAYTPPEGMIRKILTATGNHINDYIHSLDE